MSAIRERITRKTAQAVRGAAALCAVGFLAGTLAARPAEATPTDDAFAAGYATAVLERDFRVPAPSVRVRDGVVTLAASELAGADRATVTAALRRIRGVRRVELLAAAPPRAGAPGLAAGPAPGQPATSAPTEGAPGGGAGGGGTVEVMPAGLLFHPLVADPRWPHFAASFRSYLGDGRLQHVAAVSLGETMPLVRGPLGETAAWEAGLQAATFALFDRDAESADLVNADLAIGAFLGLRRDHWSAIVRAFHASSHLGDEEVLHRHPNRINLSYEALTALAAYEPWDWLRVYGGASYLLRVEPSNYARWSLQAGVEARGPRDPWLGLVRPILAADLQSREEHHWAPQVSLRGGLEVESPAVLGRRAQVLLEYFAGHSVDGQLYTRSVEYVGLGVHFGF